jgi:hypothetical protein
MIPFNGFAAFPAQVMTGLHDFENHVLRVYLSDTPPDATDTLKADLPEIKPRNGYRARDAENVMDVSGNTVFVSGTAIDWVAEGGPFGPFRYAVLYNDSRQGDPLIGWWDYGQSELAESGATVRLRFNGGERTGAILTFGTIGSPANI